MPVDYRRYPNNWHDEIRPSILARANHKCEWCGVENGKVIFRHRDDPEQYMYYDGFICCDQDGEQLHVFRKKEFKKHSIKIVLTIAHLDHDVTNNAADNLRALCNLCHLRYDAKHHAKNARITRSRKKAKIARDAGQLTFWDDQASHEVFPSTPRKGHASEQGKKHLRRDT